MVPEGTLAHGLRTMTLSIDKYTDVYLCTSGGLVSNFSLWLFNLKKDHKCLIF